VASVSRQSRSLVWSACLTLVLVGAAHSSSGGSGPGSVAGTGRPVIVVGSFDFPESVLLAYPYADALAGRGYPVRVLPGLGPRELVDPALMTGLLQLVPEYTGSALEFVSLGRIPATASIAATAGALAAAAAGRGLVTGRPAAAQDGNAIVVTAATAARYRLRTISDLARGGEQAGVRRPIAALPSGWTANGADAGNGRAVFWLDSDQAGRQAVTVTLTAACNTAGAERIPSDQPGATRFERPLTLQPRTPRCGCTPWPADASPTSSASPSARRPAWR
jgi:Substrate binding domain of ABC-type glycine betaine transport system